MDKKEILEELGGMPVEIYDQLCQDFIEDTKSKILLIRSAVEKKDYEAIQSICHSLKGSAGNLRIIQIQDTAVILEQAAKKKETQDVLSKLIEVLDNSVVVFKV